jgi:outer membrane murein-binding lipoprotein Lpp
MVRSYEIFPFSSSPLPAKIRLISFSAGFWSGGFFEGGGRMPSPVSRVFHKRNFLFIAAVVGLFCLSGCVADDQVDKAATQFVQASTTLAQVYQALLTNANSIEADDYINQETFAAMFRQPLPETQVTGPGIADSAILTPAEITLRVDAIKALTDYTTALGTLAAGKPADQIQADAAQASSSIKTFTTDLTPFITNPPKGTKAPDFATPASAAATAIGDVLKLIENHRSASEIRDNIKANDARIMPLYSMMETEAAGFFGRVITDANTFYLGVLGSYNLAIASKPVDPAAVLELSIELQQAEKDLASIQSSDPAAAIKGFGTAHAALVKLVTSTTTEDKKSSLAELIAQVKSFVAEVKTPAKVTTASSNPNS